MIESNERADVATVIDETQHWLTRAVIGLNLCPFAKSVHVKNQIRYAVTDARSLDTVLADLEDELRALAETDAAKVDTTMLIAPHAFADFTDFNDAILFADRLLAQLKLTGELQIASFHPAYRFDGTDADDIENFTNRAPYPIFHLLREASIERAADAFPDAADIYERNMATLRQLGHAGWIEWMKRR
jgi:hypothetical protein